VAGLLPTLCRQQRQQMRRQCSSETRITSASHRASMHARETVPLDHFPDLRPSILGSFVET